MRNIRIFVILLILIATFSTRAFAISDPFSRPNNFFGIHILFPNELKKARDLVDTTGGDWGYVTIPIQAGDKDIEKWQEFMNNAYDLHLIPILRLATESYYKETNVWRRPTEADILDFANFLNSLYWPVKNRYIVLFNEPNRSDEWGGDAPDATRYAEIIDYAIDVFKSKNNDFFLIMGGLDNAAPNTPGKFVDNFVFLRLMYAVRPMVFNRIDGFASHSYPNPNFSDSPNDFKTEGVSTYKFEEKLIDSFTSSKKPFFITETGWNSSVLSQDTISQYYSYVFSIIWEKDTNRIVAVTPFLLESQNGQYDKFSFLKNDEFTKFAKVFQKLPKIKGDPEITIPPPPLIQKKNDTVLGIRDFRKIIAQKIGIGEFDSLVKFYFKSIFGI